MAGPSPRTFDELLRYVQDEIQLLGRRRSSVTRDDIEALNLRLARSEEWAWKKAPTSFAREYVNRWDKSADSGGSIDASESPDWIRINEAGYYHARAVQRGGGSRDAYIALALDGNRTALEGRSDGVFTHDHSADLYNYTQSEYMGFLPAGSVLTAGPVAQSYAAYLIYGNSSIMGALTVRRIS